MSRSALLFALFLLCACVSVPHFSGARTVPAGRTEFGAAATGMFLAYDRTEGLATPLPAGGGWVRRGLAEGRDLGLRFQGVLVADVKLRIVDTKAAACAVAPGVGAGYAFHAALLQVPLLCELGRADGWRFALAASWTGAWLPGEGLEHVPGGELSLAIPVSGRWTLRPFVAADIAGSSRLGAPPAWRILQASAGVAAGYR